MRNNINTILIPDIHGRSFWKDAIPYIEQGIPAIFMGDYFDPYIREGIYIEDSIANFEELIELKKYPNVTFLLGNHDCSYLYDIAICYHRHSYDYHLILKELLERLPHQLFITKVNDWLISHAGLDIRWVEHCRQFKQWETKDNLLDEVNTNILKEPTTFLSVFDTYRGGDTDYGSIVWQDIRAFNEDNPYKQIVGHTQHFNITNNNVICIDTHRCHYIDNNNNLNIL